MKQLPEKTKKIMRVFGFVALVLATAVLSGCQSTATDVISEVSMTIPLIRGDIHDTISFIGNAQPSQTQTVTWLTSGVVESVQAAIGDQAIPGQTLAVLEKDFLSSRILMADSQIATGEESLDNFLDSATPKAQAYKKLCDAAEALDKAWKTAESVNYPVATSSQVSDAKKALDIAQQAYQDALNDYDSVKLRDSIDTERIAKSQKLQSTLNVYASALNQFEYYRDGVPQSGKDKASAALEVAQAQYDAALRSYQTYADYPREKDLNSAKLSIIHAENSFNLRIVRADIKGTITQMNLFAGQYVKKGDQAAVIEDLSVVYIPLDVSEIDVRKVTDSQKAFVVFDSYSNQTYSGVVTKVASKGNSTSSMVTYSTMIKVENSADSIKSGMTAEVQLITGTHENVFLVPYSALSCGTNGCTLQRKNDPLIETLMVQSGYQYGNLIEISSDLLKEEDAIVVSALNPELLLELGYSRETIQKIMTENGFSVGTSPNALSGQPGRQNLNAPPRGGN